MDGIEFVPRIFLNIWDHILYPYILDYDWQMLDMILIINQNQNKIQQIDSLVLYTPRKVARMNSNILR